MKDVLLDVLKARASAQAWEWAQKGLLSAQAPVNRNTVMGYYSGASRRMGKVSLALTPAETARVPTQAGALSHWGADEAYLALLLLTLAHLPPDEFVDLVLSVYRQGDAREQESWLRGLALLPGAERFLSTAIDSCRTNILLQFQAIACENPYPARYFPEPNFNQMVLKALFNTVALDRIVGLPERLNAELSRMADDYAAEREAAGRAVPADLWLAQAPHATPAALERTARYLEGKDVDHRYWAAVGLGHAVSAAAQDLLAKRRKVEKDARVRSALDAALKRASA